jgi:hypothetical protein
MWLALALVSQFGVELGSFIFAFFKVGISCSFIGVCQRSSYHEGYELGAEQARLRQFSRDEDVTAKGAHQIEIDENS